MKKEITIQILGQAGTGKTAFACYIEDHLKELWALILRVRRWLKACSLE